MKSANRKRITTIAGLVVVFWAVGLYVHIAYGSDIVYSHVAYIPIALAGIWWGRRSILVALIFGAIMLLYRPLGLRSVNIFNDLARTGFFILAAFCVGILSEKLAAGREALSRSEQKYRTIFNKSLAGIFIYWDQRIIFTNPLFRHMTGYTAGELEGRLIQDIFYSADQPLIKETIARRAAHELVDAHYECRLATREGASVWVDLASSPVMYEDGPAVLVNVYDITARKEAEEKRRELSELASHQQDQLVHSTRLAELGEMAAGIAHELNQPLTGIRNFARNAYFMLKNKAGSGVEMEENLQLISEQVDRASRIINQMRELTRRSEKQFTVLDINTVIRENAEFLEPQMKLSDVEVQLELTPDLPPVEGDRIRLGQVFLNLFTNARQAMEQTKIRVLTVRTAAVHQADGPAVRIDITDTGPGFGPGAAEKLFTPFYSTKKAGRGTGLGLSISLTILKDHAGSIEAVGRPGRGAVFIIHLPGRFLPV